MSTLRQKHNLLELLVCLKPCSSNFFPLYTRYPGLLVTVFKTEFGSQVTHSHYEKNAKRIVLVVYKINITRQIYIQFKENISDIRAYISGVTIH